MKTTKMLTPFLLSTLFLLSIGSSNVSAQKVASGEGASSIAVIVEARASRLIYSINGKIAKDPLRTLETLWNANSRDAVVDIMIDPHTTFLQLGEAEGLVSKAGFQHTNVFVYSRESNMRERIIRNPPEHYSAKS